MEQPKFHKHLNIVSYPRLRQLLRIDVIFVKYDYYLLTDIL